MYPTKNTYPEDVKNYKSTWKKKNERLERTVHKENIQKTNNTVKAIRETSTKPQGNTSQ